MTAETETTPPAEEPEADGAPPDPGEADGSVAEPIEPQGDTGPEPRSEAAKWRRRLRETEQQLASAQERVDAAHWREIERLATTEGIAAEGAFGSSRRMLTSIDDLRLAGGSLDDYRDANGDVDPGRVAAKLEELHATRPHWFSQPGSFGDALDGGARPRPVRTEPQSFGAAMKQAVERRDGR